MQTTQNRRMSMLGWLAAAVFDNQPITASAVEKVTAKPTRYQKATKAPFNRDHANRRRKIAHESRRINTKRRKAA